MSSSYIDYFVSNIFIDGKEFYKEDIIINWNSPPIFDKYLDENCELCMSSQVVDDDDDEILQKKTI